MDARLRIGDREFAADHAAAIDLATPLDFEGPQPCWFGADPARAEPFRAGGFTGDTTRGGSCNVPELRLVPHLNGTHTECVGHIVDDAVRVLHAAPRGPVPATLVTLDPEPRDPPAAPVLTREALARVLDAAPDDELHAVVVRTRPNPVAKRTRRYTADDPPPCLEPGAAGHLAERGVRHLLVDLPSLDPMHDEGRLAAHRAFFEVPEGSRRLAPVSRRDRTVTELIYVPDEVPDGAYALLLVVPPFLLDAAPSRPLLFPRLGPGEGNRA